MIVRIFPATTRTLQKDKQEIIDLGDSVLKTRETTPPRAAYQERL